MPKWPDGTHIALAAPDITQVPYALIDGNCQGCSFERTVAVSPVVKYPLVDPFEMSQSHSACHPTVAFGMEMRPDYARPRRCASQRRPLKIGHDRETNLDGHHVRQARYLQVTGPPTDIGFEKLH
jgi:hypothetical protein